MSEYCVDVSEHCVCSIFIGRANSKNNRGKTAWVFLQVKVWPKPLLSQSFLTAWGTVRFLQRILPHGFNLFVCLFVNPISACDVSLMTDNNRCTATFLLPHKSNIFYKEPSNSLYYNFHHTQCENKYIVSYICTDLYLDKNSLNFNSNEIR